MQAQVNSEPIPGYRLIERLGQGGFGEVWKAEVPGGLFKAIKLVMSGPIRGHASESQEHTTHVEQELRGLSRMREIRHPYILNTERLDMVDGQLVVVMELADRDLSDRLQECRKAGLPGIPSKELFGYMLEIAEALDFMNTEHDIQHLDIKPKNLFLVHKHVKVADFGMAKDLEGISSSITGGMTPIYAAPEVFGGKLSRASDQYSLAIVYQELLTGRRPFPGPTAAQFMMQHLMKSPNVGLLPNLQQPIVSKALSKEAENRFDNCTAFIQALLDADVDKQKSVVLKPLGEEVDSESKTVRFSSRVSSLQPPASSLQFSGPIIGIDLGTSNSVVAVLEGKEAKVTSNQEGYRLTPSVVAFTDSKDDERLVGIAAARQATTNPKRTISSIKRLMGRRAEEVQRERKLLSYELVGKGAEPVQVKIAERNYSPPEISAMVLRKLREAAEEYLGQEVSEAVITVPAYFNDSQRQATKDAGRIAGLQVRRIINEPTAASLAYGFGEETKKKLAVFDLGGGTFDITILHQRNGVFDVLSTNGDTHLGGDDFDEEIVKFLAEEFEREHQFDPRRDVMALQRLREAALRAKEELSSRTQTEINLPFLAAGSSGPKHLKTTLSRARFEHLTEHLMERCIGPCQQALEDAGLDTSEIDEVILVGGSTRMPKVREIVPQIFRQVPRQGVNPDEAVAMGAAIQAGMLSGDVGELLLLDVTPLSLGVEARGGVMSSLVERNTTIPTVVRKVFSTAEENQNEVGVHVLQGEREFAKDNRSLGKFWLGGIPAAPAGSPQIEIIFSIDANGILDVSAKNLKTDKQQSIRIEASSSLDNDQIERMLREAEEYAAKDREYRELRDAQNAAESEIFEAERLLVERTGPMLTKQDKEAIRRAIDKLRDACQNEDPTRITSAIWELQQVLNAWHISAQRRSEAGVV